MHDPKPQKRQKEDDITKMDQNEINVTQDSDEENLEIEDNGDDEYKDVTMMEIPQWLSTIGLKEKYEKKVEEEQYTSMEKIMGLNRSQIDLMIKVVGFDSEEASKILQSLEEIQRIHKWKNSLCGTWTNDMNDEIKIKKNNERKIVVDMHCLGKPKLSGYIAISKNHFLLHYDEYPGVFGTLEQNATMESDCSILIWYHDSKYTRWYSVNDNIEEVRKWLMSLGLEKYLRDFQAHKYNSMDIIKSLNKSEIEVMMNAVGCKKGSSLKIMYSLGLLDKEKKQVFNPYAPCHWNEEVNKIRETPKFEQIGGQHYNLGDFPQATFWFFQHKVHELGGSQYPNFELAGSKCDEEWKEFPKFLIEQFRQGNIRQSTNWEEIQNTWRKEIAVAENTQGFDEVFEWLSSMKLEKYARRFEEEEYDSMELIRGLSESQVEEMIKLVGCKGGAAAKIQQSLYGSTKKSSWMKFDPDKKGAGLQKHEIKRWERKKKPQKKDGKYFDPYNCDYWKNYDPNKAKLLEEKRKKVKEYEGADAEDKPVQKDHEVYHWLRSLECDEYHRKFEEEGFTSMDKLIALKGSQIMELLENIGVSSSDSDKISQSLAAKRHPRYIKIKHKHGVEIITKSEYPGVCIGIRLEQNEVASYVETKTVDHLGYGITFYKLKDGRGWVHNFVASSPGSSKVIQELYKSKKSKKTKGNNNTGN